ncbi:hypothetical protein CLOSTASPAR_05473 [[Clostridium] asparagiforme DSM 15981]|uniref:Uncharacterized protein n=1 Tax=[Clostridium] asparagiforme DSM 15981 TaxID=518636 RepID=C0D876_9FIRM|nr:hypothetical protein CLOSTASPAR_05473 [[Clostridium] asparagiforme DSM 15981]
MRKNFVNSRTPYNYSRRPDSCQGIFFISAFFRALLGQNQVKPRKMPGRCGPTAALTGHSLI